MAAVGQTAERAPATGGTPGWLTVVEQELRDLWTGGRGLVLSFAFSVLLSLIAYLVATNTALNFLEARESVNLTLQVAIAVGALLALLGAADAVSGERERGTLETLLLTPVPRRQVAVAKLLSAFSLWAAAFVVTVPYVWFLGRGPGIVGDAILTGLVVGTLLAVFLAALGMIISLFAGSNRVSLSLSLFLLLALFAPTQLPASAQKGWAGELLLRVNPITAGEHYVGKIVTNGHAWSEDVSWLISPAIAAVVFAVAAPLLAARFIRLRAVAAG
jgi:ABC-2 type transport system permease protein